MDNFKIGVFDLFGAILPGIPIVVLFVLFGKMNLDVSVVVHYVTTMNLNAFVFWTLICYSVGFVMQYLSYEVFKIILERNKTFWSKRIGKHPISIGKRGKKITLIRHYSPENFKILNTFMALRTMCYNMFFSLFLFFVSVFFISAFNCSWGKETFLILFITLCFKILFLRRAVSFHEWIQNMISECNPILKKELGNKF